MPRSQVTEIFLSWGVKENFMKRLRPEEKGFTLIDLIIVIAIIGILVAIVTPNMAAFITSGVLNAAQTEAENVKTAATGYLAEYEIWPQNSGDLANFLDGTSKATYVFGGNAGIESVIDQEWEGVYWDADAQSWVKGEEPEAEPEPEPAPVPIPFQPVPTHPIPHPPVPFR